MKLKKSLLIVPAMATLLFAAAGSVGGTVAWFSANTVFQTNITSFKVVNLEGDLNCTMSAGTGTSYDSGNKKISVTTNAELTHGSFNHSDLNVYLKTGASAYASKATLNTAGATTIGNLQASTYTVGETTHTVYYAVTWSMAFTYKLPVSADEAEATNLYLDLANSVFTPTTGDSSLSLKTQKGFRIAFIPNPAGSVTTSGNAAYTRVWADLETSDGCSYVASTSTTSGYTNGETAASKVLISSADTATIAEGTAGTTNLNYCLGQFSSFSSGDSKIGFTCVAWFEGTDANVVSAASMDQVAVNLAFYTRPNA